MARQAKPLPREAIAPAPYERADVMAFKAMLVGNANDLQQKRALKFLIEDICRTYDLSFRPGVNGARDTDFAEGKRSAGLQIVHLLNMKAEDMPPQKGD